MKVFFAIMLAVEARCSRYTIDREWLWLLRFCGSLLLRICLRRGWGLSPNERTTPM